MKSISCHITPLVINSLGGSHTHIHVNTHTDDLHRINFKKPVPGLKIDKCVVMSNLVYQVISVVRLYLEGGRTLETSGFIVKKLDLQFLNS